MFLISLSNVGPFCGGERFLPLIAECATEEKYKGKVFFVGKMSTFLEFPLKIIHFPEYLSYILSNFYNTRLLLIVKV